MQSAIIQFFLFFCVYAAYAIACFLIGKQINKLIFSGNRFSIIQNAFLNLLFGDAVVITLYSIVKSHFLTINIVIAILLVVTILIKKFFIKNSVESKPVQEMEFKLNYKLYLGFIILILPFIVRAIVYYNYSYHLPNIPQWDYQYYLTLSETFNQTGNENFFCARSILFNEFTPVTPYRYHDTWLASLFLENHSLISIGVYNLVVSSFTNLLALLGLLSVFELYKKISINTVLWTTLFLFTGFAYFSVANVYVDTNTPIEYQKLGMTYATLAAAIIFYKKEMNLQAALTICILFVYGVTGLTMITGLGALLAFVFLFKKGGKDYILYAILPIITIVCFGVFYRLFGFKDLGVAFTLPTVKVFLYSIKSLTIKIFARYWYLYIWIILALVFNKNVIRSLKNDKRTFILGIYFIIFCMLLQAIIINLGDANQFATCNASPLLHILLYIAVVYVFINIPIKKPLNIAITGLFILYLVYSPYAAYTSKVGIYNEHKRLNRYSKEYLAKVEEAVKHIDNRIGVYWVDSSYFTTNNRMKEYFMRPGEYLKVMGNNFDLLCLTPELMPIGNDENAKFIQAQSALIVFQKKNLGLSLIDLKLKFIRDYKMEYLILGKGAILPQAIDTLVSQKIVDTTSGDTFCLLRK
jgi:hypothetical protein